MITDEYVDSLLTRLVRAGSNTEREIIESWIKPILIAERNRLLDECLGICDKKANQPGMDMERIGIIADIRNGIEALRHE